MCVRACVCVRARVWCSKCNHIILLSRWHVETWDICLWKNILTMLVCNELVNQGWNLNIVCTCVCLCVYLSVCACAYVYVKQKVVQVCIDKLHQIDKLEGKSDMWHVTVIPTTPPLTPQHLQSKVTQSIGILCKHQQLCTGITQHGRELNCPIANVCYCKVTMESNGKQSTASGLPYWPYHIDRTLIK